jgi:hypothetical protein
MTVLRRLTVTGHQTAVISTAHALDSIMIASRMFARWCQDNFFAYTRLKFSEPEGEEFLDFGRGN